MSKLSDVPAFPCATPDGNTWTGLTLRAYLLAHEPLADPLALNIPQASALFGAPPDDLAGQIKWNSRVRAYIRVAQVDALIAQLENHAPASGTINQITPADDLLELQRAIITDMPEYLRDRVRYIAADPGAPNPMTDCEQWAWYAYETPPCFTDKIWKGQHYWLRFTRRIPNINPSQTLVEISKL